MSDRPSSVIFGGSGIDYAITRTARRKALSIAVDEGEVVLTAPRDTTVERVHALVWSP